MATPTDPIFQCPKCQHMATLTDRKVTAYRIEEKTGPGTVRQIPAATDYTYRCQNSTCGHIFTRSVKH
jgi:hypothetical protein